MTCWSGSLLDRYLTAMDALALSLRWRCVRRHAYEEERRNLLLSYREDVEQAAKIAYQNGRESVGDE
jgi:hypothetical protein